MTISCGTLAHSLKLIWMSATSMPATLTVLLYLLLLLASAYGLRSIHAPIPGTAAAFPGCLPTHDGFLRARMRGERDVEIDWRDADMHCEGGLRPEDVGGMRVTFVGRLPQDGREVRMIFGISAATDATSQRNVPANVTIIFENESRIYSTAGDGKCTIDELTLQPSAQAHGTWRRVVARGFCMVPVTTPFGAGEALELDRFDFAGGLRDED
jgi:hypothetical protein